jgi:hypothetical protein
MSYRKVRNRLREYVSAENPPDYSGINTTKGRSWIPAELKVTSNAGLHKRISLRLYSRPERCGLGKGNLGIMVHPSPWLGDVGK